MLTLINLLNLDRLLNIKSVKALGNVYSELVQPNTLPETMIKTGTKIYENYAPAYCKG